MAKYKKNNALDRVKSLEDNMTQEIMSLIKSIFGEGDKPQIPTAPLWLKNMARAENQTFLINNTKDPENKERYFLSNHNNLLANYYSKGIAGADTLVLLSKSSMAEIFGLDSFDSAAKKGENPVVNNKIKSLRKSY